MGIEKRGHGHTEAIQHVQGKNWVSPSEQPVHQKTCMATLTNVNSTADWGLGTNHGSVGATVRAIAQTEVAIPEEK